jgi:hypothetical protein
MVTDAGGALTGAAFGAFFYHVVNEAGEQMMLYTLSGAPREAFSGFPMPRRTALLTATFEGSDVIRVDDIAADPRYGHNTPLQSMPKGHLPVVSYLAVPAITLRVEAPEERLVAVVDAAQLESALLNLVINARDASPPAASLPSASPASARMCQRRKISACRKVHILWSG